MEGKSSSLDWIVKVSAVLGLALATVSFGWQVHTYHASLEENLMVRGSLTQNTLGRTGFEGGNWKLGVEVTNIGPHAILVKNITLSGWNRVWIVYAGNEKTPTMPLEPGVPFAWRTEWDYAKHPILGLDDSEPADFVVKIETTRTVHVRPMKIYSITVTGTIPRPK